jgi:hypothetical protein
MPVIRWEFTQLTLIAFTYAGILLFREGVQFSTVLGQWRAGQARSPDLSLIVCSSQLLWAFGQMI